MSEKVSKITDIVDLSKLIFDPDNMPVKSFEFIGDSKIQIQALSPADKDFFDQFQQNNMFKAVIQPGTYLNLWSVFGKTLLKAIKGWENFTLANMATVVPVKLNDQNKKSKVVFNEKNLTLLLQNSSTLAIQLLQYAANRELYVIEDEGARLNG